VSDGCRTERRGASQSDAFRMQSDVAKDTALRFRSFLRCLPCCHSRYLPCLPIPIPIPPVSSSATIEHSRIGLFILLCGWFAEVNALIVRKRGWGGLYEGCGRAARGGGAMMKTAMAGCGRSRGEREDGSESQSCYGFFSFAHGCLSLECVYIFLIYLLLLLHRLLRRLGKGRRESD
jgi:hypothetical protein